jgi:hypothetical protein
VLIQLLYVLRVAGAAAAQDVERRGHRGPVYVRRGDLRDVLSRGAVAPLTRVPEADAHLLHHLVHVGVGEPVPPADAPHHRGEVGDHRLEGG